MTDLRQKILDASVKLVAENGVRAMSFREVARIADVSHQAPYHYFENYLAIMRAIAQEGFSILGKAMADAGAKHPGNSLAALNAAGNAYVNFATSHLGHFRVMFQRSLVDIHDPKLPLVEGEATFSVLQRLVAAAHADGYGRGMEQERIALICWSVVHGIATLLTEGIVATREGQLSVPADAIAEMVVSGLSNLLDGEGRKTKPKKIRKR